MGKPDSTQPTDDPCFYLVIQEDRDGELHPSMGSTRADADRYIRNEAAVGLRCFGPYRLPEKLREAFRVIGGSGHEFYAILAEVGKDMIKGNYAEVGGADG